MISFRREVIVDKYYEKSIKDFMANYYAGAMPDYEDGSIIRIYVNSTINNGNVSYVFDVPYMEGMDTNEDKDVEKMIRAWYKKCNKDKEGFTL
tara:strand:+ start:3886 stop:4164 length:279 start_codon:yes stop_codon:yes gene_type:complete